MVDKRGRHEVPHGEVLEYKLGKLEDAKRALGDIASLGSTLVVGACLEYLAEE